ncbi:MAG: hypothetical protein P3T54_00020 [Dehalogenimonas sp.]|nr:hypothetical protein [Dehalogenimonas sp.]
MRVLNPDDFVGVVFYPDAFLVGAPGGEINPLPQVGAVPHHGREIVPGGHDFCFPDYLGSGFTSRIHFKYFLDGRSDFRVRFIGCPLDWLPVGLQADNLLDVAITDRRTTPSGKPCPCDLLQTPESVLSHLFGVHFVSSGQDGLHELS